MATSNPSMETKTQVSRSRERGELKGIPADSAPTDSIAATQAVVPRTEVFKIVPSE
jgi:hypothetical protein